MNQIFYSNNSEKFKSKNNDEKLNLPKNSKISDSLTTLEF